ncbi:MAG TPA: CheR family methyltransferase [Candidatus Sulfotelmatobacter sp.]|nr:CheR family methyltransferase [Candidatus Sulfotelmatobacter sp.]
MAELHTLKELVHRLAEERGIDLRGYKVSTVERRVRRRMQQLGIDSYKDYLGHVERNAGEAAKLLDTVLINVTRFFRDVQAWDILAEKVLPALFKQRPPGSSFRVWCAGCATGEEPYSIAILLYEMLGTRVKDYEIKLYATDNDESALNTARRAEYPPDSVRGVPEEIKAKYFTGERLLRVARDVRRMVIFGRSNLMTDAPISHVDLLLCRNVLIYFDAVAQARVIGRLKYALNDGGVLFLGKAESQLRRNSGLLAIDQRWRIFQKHSITSAASRPGNTEAAMKMEPESKEQNHEEMERLKLFYDTVVATLEPGVLVLDSGDRVITDNEKLLNLWELSGKLVGHKLQETELWSRCPDLKQNLDASRNNGPTTVRFDCYSTPSTVVAVTIKPIFSESGAGQVGTLIYMENVTSRVTLQSTIEELETTAEELQSANEELETTNEELQSSNEELETTNEELQSTNEELETTNEELQSLNEELETTNEELSSRTRELDEVNTRYSEMMERMPWPVLLVNEDTMIYLFNSAAQKLFGFARPSEKGMRLQELPQNEAARQAIVRRHRSVMQTRKQSSIQKCALVTNRFSGVVDIHFTPLSTESGSGVIVMFQVENQTQPKDKKNVSKGRAQSRAKKAATKRAPRKK